LRPPPEVVTLWTPGRGIDRWRKVYRTVPLDSFIGEVVFGDIIAARTGAVVKNERIFEERFSRTKRRKSSRTPCLSFTQASA
jgi:hypothetical protein